MTPMQHSLPGFLPLALVTVCLSACERPADPVVTPPKDGIPTHVPKLAPQVEALQRASKVEGATLESADAQRRAIEEATR